ncbi:hypothetical protein FTW19_23240 [Terriglobus albidus]|uniref:Uncharacterized protein n=1 Tax=Terriglobus albidus TaxID=1592106 RepID=A0A5B9EJR2_9BACT|nr:hypothetical protein [Terriglobus albidus]QEE30647.1 hypothetical protein FTW19_23240 [Terriglobus albidus]
MRILSLFALVPFFASTAGGSAVLRLDSDPNNRCMKAKEGGMWVLQNPQPLPLGRNSQPSTVVVTLLRSDNSTNPPRQVVYTLSNGQTVELECAQGKNPVTYQIVDQR